MRNLSARLGLMILVPLAARAQPGCQLLDTHPASALSVDGLQLVAAGAEGVRLLETGEPQTTTVIDSVPGAAVSVSSVWMAVGVPTSGVVHLYHREAGGWERRKSLTGRPGSRFGASVALGDHWLAVGAPEDGAVREGLVYIFSSPAWTPVKTIPSGDGRLNDRFGASVAVDGDTIAVGAPYADDLKEYYNFGAVYVFTAPDWNHPVKLRASETFRKGDIQFGASVAVQKGLLVVGAPGDDPAGKESAGSAYLFKQDGTWSKLSDLLPEDEPKPGRQLGTSVAIDGSFIAVGAPFGGNGGAVYRFHLNGQWKDLCTGCGASELGRSVALLKGDAFLGGPSGAGGCFEIPPLKPDLTCELETLPATVVAGGTAAYTVRVTNRGPGTAEPARLEVETPPELSASCAPEGCSVPIPAEKSRNFVISFTLPPGCSSPISIQPRFSVRSGTGETEDCSPPPILVQRPRMDLVCRKSGPEFVEPGGRVVYQVEVTNNGCKPFRDVDVSDPAPPFLERDCGGSACASRIARIEPGETRNVSFAFRVSPDYSHTAIMNVASIVQAKPPETDMENNSCTARTEVRCPGLPLGIQGSVEGEKSEVPEGSIFTYHLRLANGGPGVLEDGPRSELIQTSRFNFLSSEIVAGGGQLYLGCPSGCPFGDLHWNGSIPPCGNVDIQVTAIADHAGEFCLDATFVDLDGRLRPATPYCFRIVPGISLPSGGR
jgi:uncharacterized repeat protein (TIGR01451 family)